jgi:prephenate dehydrogenase
VTRPTRVAIAGLGLVGGSLARALTAAGHHVIGVDTLAVRRRALRQRAVAATAATVVAAARDADVVVLAAPPRANLVLLRALDAAAVTALVTDVGSVKRPICAAAARTGLRFVGGHPMAGAETSGFGASRADLFAGQPWILTPEDATPGDLRRLRQVLRATGARFTAMSAAHHDRTVAFLSHVPQLVAWAMAAAAGGDPVAREHLAVAGPGFRGMTRLAASPRRLWREILAQNEDEVRRALRAFVASLRARP